MLGLLDISQVTHRIEELFVRARTAAASKPDGQAASQAQLLNAGAFDTVFGALDALSLRVEQLASGMTTSVDVTALCQSLAALVSETADVHVPGAAADTEPEAGVSVAVSSPMPASMATRNTLRVPVERLDGLTHLAAELVIQSLKTSERHAELRRIDIRIGRLRDRMREARLAPDGQPAGNELSESAEALEHVSRHLRQVLASFSDDCVRLNLITEEFRQTVIELTMLPLGTVFDAFPRAARDLARQFGKDVEVTIRGSETELDKKIIEQISDPLIHLLRNAIDHGIETPDERISKGKPASGQLLISAEQQGNRIIVTVRDDGKGIDPQSLRTAALRDGLAPEADLERWTEQELLDLVFQPGFSTRDSATDVSGRGVGMDVVRAVVLRLGGAVAMQSAPGQGTTIVLDLPLSLALLRVVLVETAGEMYALPTAAVRRVLHLRREDLGNADGALSLELDGETIPLAALSVLLNGTMAPYGLRQPVLTVAAGDHIFGLIVDAVHEEQELVFEELRHPLRDQRTFAGAAILGNGDIVPILDVHALREMAGHAPTAESQAAPAAKTAGRAARVLVVEDSLVAGEMQKSILVAAGYEVEIAHDGAEALEVLAQRPWDLVVADVDMPRMDGFELTERMRADERFRTLPIIIVTARDSAEDRRRGFVAGADAYVLKREFDQIQLLDVVQRLISRGAPTRA
jgi:two-component system chemotaxis sensor kinase CheA